MNKQLFYLVLEHAAHIGVTTFCVCPGSRNSPLVETLMQSPSLTKHFWYEERSAAFFALGKARATQAPVAVVTTSGSAAGELLPAVMEAHYTGTPLLLITADRPRRFRGTGAPQAAEQKDLFGPYVRFSQDLEDDEPCLIENWDLSGPAHLNVCLEEPKSYSKERREISASSIAKKTTPHSECDSPLIHFFQQSRAPLVIVSALSAEEREPVCHFLLELQAPIYCESASGLREHPELAPLQVRMDKFIWELSTSHGYPIDGILRIGGVPVTRLWRDLEDKPHQLAECSISHTPFSGLSWGRHIQCDVGQFFSRFKIPIEQSCNDFSSWIQRDRELCMQLESLLEQFPSSEPSLFRALSNIIPPHSLVYLGNSLPVREWDLAATFESKNITVETSRGVNGIDGQLSTFLGLCKPGRENWVILGDLTMLYDFAALWILNTMMPIPIKIVVMNNGGGKIFSRIYKDPVFQHLHGFDFEHFAKSWKVPYIFLNGAVESSAAISSKHLFMEIVPDPVATDCFWKAYDTLLQALPV